MTLSNPTVEANVPTWAQKYCDALEANYKNYHIDSMKRMASRPDSSTYANEQLEKIESGEAKLMKFRANPGKKYFNRKQETKRVNIAISQLLLSSIKRQVKYTNQQDGRDQRSTSDLT
jgi:hypothetical protein